MAKVKPPAEPNDETKPQPDGSRIATALGRTVITTIGRPVDFFRVTVVHLWENRYRVNVLTGTDISKLTIAHSYFVAADENGNVLESTPPLTRRN
jgi:hypothetical protein